MNDGNIKHNPAPTNSTFEYWQQVPAACCSSWNAALWVPAPIGDQATYAYEHAFNIDRRLSSGGHRVWTAHHASTTARYALRTGLFAQHRRKKMPAGNDCHHYGCSRAAAVSVCHGMYPHVSVENVTVMNVVAEQCSTLNSTNVVPYTLCAVSSCALAPTVLLVRLRQGNRGEWTKKQCWENIKHTIAPVTTLDHDNINTTNTNNGSW